MSESQRQAFLSALHELENLKLDTTSQTLDPSHVSLRVLFRLKRGCLTLCKATPQAQTQASPSSRKHSHPSSAGDGAQGAVAELEFVQLECGFEARPGVDGASFEIKLQAMNLYDARSTRTRSRPIVCSKSLSGPASPTEADHAKPNRRNDGIKNRPASVGSFMVDVDSDSSSSHFK